jgi:hypothetical protein
MTDKPFGRQPQPIRVVMIDDARDVAHYRQMFMGYIERNSYDTCVYNTADDSFTIYPRAVND